MRAGLALAFLLVSGCTSSPLYHAPPTAEPPAGIQSAGRFMLFSMLVRSVAAANSQGFDWTARRDEADYTRLQERLTETMTQPFSLQVVDFRDLSEQTLYREARWPVQERYYLNPNLMPIVQDAGQEDLMLRVGSALYLDYMATALWDYSISKIMLRAGRISCRLQLNLYRPEQGLVWHAEFESSETAEPYDRSLSLDELFHGYEAVTGAALNRCEDSVLDQLQSRVRSFPVLRGPTENTDGTRF